MQNRDHQSSDEHDPEYHGEPDPDAVSLPHDLDDHPAEPSSGDHSSPPDADQPDINRTIAFDLTCIACNYNLRGMLDSGTCPECGAPVRQSIRTNHLAQASGPWLETIKRGLIWMIIGNVGGFVLAMLVGVIFAALYMSSLTTGNVPVPMAIATILVTLLASGVLLYSFTLLCTPEPGENTPPPHRLYMRIGLYGSLVVSLLSSFALLLPASSNAAIITLLDSLSMLMYSVGLVALLLYLKTLAERIPNPSLARQSVVVSWGFALSFGTLAIGDPILDLLFNYSNSPSMGFVGVFLCPSILGVITFVIWWLVLTCLYISAISNAIHLGKRRTTEKLPY